MGNRIKQFFKKRKRAYPAPRNNHIMGASATGWSATIFERLLGILLIVLGCVCTISIVPLAYFHATGRINLENAPLVILLPVGQFVGIIGIAIYRGLLSDNR